MSTSPIERLEPGPRFSQCVLHGETVYLAGQVPDDGSTTVAAQTRSVLRQIDRRLEAVGSSKERILSATIYLADAGTAGEMNEAWDAWVDARHLPVRATVEARLVNPDYLVEICVVAAR